MIFGHGIAYVYLLLAILFYLVRWFVSDSFGVLVERLFNTIARGFILMQLLVWIMMFIKFIWFQLP